MRAISTCSPFIIAITSDLMQQLPRVQLRHDAAPFYQQLQAAQRQNGRGLILRIAATLADSGQQLESKC